MWWDQARREWRKHPHCTCDHDPCVCHWLRPLDRFGVPIPSPVIDALREHHDDPECGCPACRKQELAAAEARLTAQEVA